MKKRLTFTSVSLFKTTLYYTFTFSTCEHTNKSQPLLYGIKWPGLKKDNNIKALEIVRKRFRIILHAFPPCTSGKGHSFSVLNQQRE